MRYIMGLFLVIIGVLFIVQGFNFDLLFRIGLNFVKFWPLILVMIGISILSKDLKWLKFFNMIIAAIFVLLLFFWNYNTTFVNFSENSTNYEKINFEILPDNDIMDLHFDISAVTLDISIDENSERISGYYYGPQQLNITPKNGYIRFEDIGKRNFSIQKQNGYKVYLTLPSDYVFNIFISGGVANIELNENMNIIRNFEVDSGVANIKGEISEFKENLYFDVDGGISRINFLLPENTTYYLDYDGGIKKISVDNDLIEDLEGVFQVNVDAGILTINLKTE